MAHPSDLELLERFRTAHDRDALDQIVRRYIGLVYSAARRQVRDPHLAADITQAVFIVLVRKAESLETGTALPAWLYTVTRHAIANARRVQSRRQRFHETVKAIMTHSEPTAPAADVSAETADEIRSVLDDGLSRLGRLERSTILMYFFGNKSHREVGDALGLTEEAARKRLSRGLEKLRSIMLDRSGAAIGSASILASALVAENASASAVLASQPAMINTTVNVAMLANSLAASAAAGHITGAAGAIAHGVVRMIRLARLRRVATVGCLCLLVVGLIAPLFASTWRDSARKPQPSKSGTGAAAANVGAAATPPAPVPIYRVLVNATTTIELLGVSPYPPDAGNWFAADGRPIDLPDPQALGVRTVTAVPPQYAIAVRIVHPGSSLFRLQVDRADAGANAMIPGLDDSVLLVCVFSFQAAPSAASLKLGIADGEWNTRAGNDRPTEMAEREVNDIGVLRFDPIVEADGGGTQVVVAHPSVLNPDPSQIVVIDDTGKEHAPRSIDVQSIMEVRTTCTFDLPPTRVARVAWQTRPFQTFVEMTDVSLEAGRETHPKMTVRTH